MNAKDIIHKMKTHSPDVLGQSYYRNYSILLPFIEKEGELHLVFEVRSLNMRRQPGEVCFPGGRVDEEDRMERDTAVREAMEELGIRNQEITEVHPFDYMVSPFGMKVSTYVGFMECSEEEMEPNPAEVEEVFTVPLSFFLNTKPEAHYVRMKVEPEEGFPFELIPGGENYNWRTQRFPEYFYQYGDKVIWGLTASVIVHFIDMIQN
ncbi:NUDIX hydrolase [Halobacillus salinus]|uniref:CoA pyrophosphatase n=1 Tax=Halobacillus salinus TaxID=192814 RepID=A0A4Z0GYI5_9BACI|nr:CoA pyrophosphatase [Halobacillus salinus]TGB02909.1 CoA pyrophosphatase [Halobacillus salinus]